MENSIIVKNLPSDIYVAELCDKFRCFGRIISATVQANESDFEAYIAFENSFGAIEAVKQMNGVKLKKNTIKVLMSSENERFKKVFVKNINPNWDECDLLKEFEDIGTIEDAKISEGRGKSNGYGFLVFNTHTAAKKAVANKNGKKINGLTMIVERYKSKSERESLMQNSLDHVEEKLINTTQYNNLHVKNIPLNMKEGEFKKLFEKFGEILSVKVMTDERGASRGFGFVCFADEESASTALQEMDGYHLKGKKLEVSFKEDGRLRKQYARLKNKAREVKMNQYKQRSKSLPKLLPHPLIYRSSVNIP